MEGENQFQIKLAENRKAIENRQFQEAEANVVNRLGSVELEIDKLNDTEVLNQKMLEDTYKTLNNATIFYQNELDRDPKMIEGYFDFRNILGQLTERVQDFQDLLMVSTNITKDFVLREYNKIIAPVKEELKKSIQKREGADKKDGDLVEAA